MALTWREINAPNTQGATGTFLAASNQIQQGITGLSDLATNYGNKEQTNNTAAALAQVTSATNTDELALATTPEALSKYGDYDRAQIANAVSNLRKQFSASEQQANQFNQQQALSERQLAQQEAYQTGQLANAKANTTSYNRALNLQEDKVKLEKLGIAAYDQGFKEGGEFSNKTEIDSYLATKQQQLLDSGKSATEVSQYTKGIRDRFQDMMVNSPTASVASSVIQEQTKYLENVATTAIDAIKTTSSVANPDNAVLAQLPGLSQKLASNQDAIAMLKTTFGSSDGVGDYITKGRKESIPLDILVSSALQQAGTSDLALFGTIGNENFNPDNAINQAKRITNGLKDGTIKLDNTNVEIDTAKVDELKAKAAASLNKVGEAVLFSGTVKARKGEDSAEYKKALEAVNKNQEEFNNQLATLQKYRDIKIEPITKGKVEVGGNTVVVPTTESLYIPAPFNLPR